MQCAQCRREIDNNSKYCPFCGGKAEIRQINERDGNTDKKNADGNEKSVGLMSITSYEWLINILVVLSAVVGGGIGILFDTASGSPGIWTIIMGTIGALAGFLCVLPMKIMAAIAHNVYISTDSILAIKRQLEEMGEKGAHTEEEAHIEEEIER